MNNPIALALLINHESRTTFAPDRQPPRRVSPRDPGQPLVSRLRDRLGLRRAHRAGATA